MKINVLEYLKETAYKYSEKIGFEDSSKQLSFGDFNQTALNISTNIIENYDQIKKPIGVFLPKSINALVAFMGILYSGNIYMPLDVKKPTERIKGILS